MSRPSRAAGHDEGRMSLFPGGTSSSGTPASRLQAKRQELEGLLQLKEQSARLARDVEVLGDNVDELVEGGEGES